VLLKILYLFYLCFTRKHMGITASKSKLMSHVLHTPVTHIARAEQTHVFRYCRVNIYLTKS